VTESKTKPKADEDKASVVIEHLLAHPDFFNEHSHVLTKMNLAHDSGTASSLIERQVTTLRRQNHKSHAELHDATKNARLNEQLSDKIHQLSLRLLAADGLSASLTETVSCLKKDFDINWISLRLWQDQIDSPANDLPDSVTIASSNDDAIAPYRETLQRGEVICGQLNADQIEQFFGPHDDIASAALLPLRHKKTFGVIGLGCVREDRFRRDQGTVFLTRFAELISHKLWLDLNAH